MLSHSKFHELNFHKIINILLNNGYSLELIFNTIKKRLFKKSRDQNNNVTHMNNEQQTDKNYIFYNTLCVCSINIRKIQMIFQE